MNIDNSQSVAVDGSALRSRREALFLSREALAARAGVSSGTVRNVENGSVRPLGQTLQAMRRALHIHDPVAEIAAPKTARAGIETLTSARALTDPSLHPERFEEAGRVSVALDDLIETAKWNGEAL